MSPDIYWGGPSSAHPTWAPEKTKVSFRSGFCRELFERSCQGAYSCTGHCGLISLMNLSRHRCCAPNRSLFLEKTKVSFRGWAVFSLIAVFCNFILRPPVRPYS